MAKTAIMQPYFMPYLGYWQLIHAVDHFVFYDDVNFIKKGWVNRNQTADAEQAHRFTVPLQKASQNTRICDLKLADLETWKNKWFTALKYQYAKAPKLKFTLELLDEGFQSAEGIADLCWNTNVQIHQLFGMQTKLYRSSIHFPSTQQLGRVERLASITKACASETYVNPPGGKELYSSADFKAHGLALKFLQPTLHTYNRGKGVFIPGLSIIDPIMWLGVEGCKALLDGYSLEN